MPLRFESALSSSKIAGAGHYQPLSHRRNSGLQPKYEEADISFRAFCPKSCQLCGILCLILFSGIFFIGFQLFLNKEFIGESMLKINVVLNNKKLITSDDGTNNSKKLLRECRLPRSDPWDPQIMPYLDPDHLMVWTRDCVPTVLNLTFLVPESGKVKMDSDAQKNGTLCEFRCLYPKTDYAMFYGDWKAIGGEPDCDVVETRCKHEKLNNGTFYYNNMHLQIYKQLNYHEKRKQRPVRGQDAWTSPSGGKYFVPVEDTPDFANSKNETKMRAPDVHVIVFDSVSHPQMLRTLTKTISFLREQMEAISFPHLNKVGLNSRPNGYGFLFGWPSNKLETNPMAPEFTPPRDLDTLGGIYLDKEPFIGFDFRERKYRTMMAEDWAKGVFNWPGSYGFGRPPVDHYMRPYHLRLDEEKALADALQDSKTCREAHNWIFDYLKEFMFVYEDEPKFSITWMSWIAHHNVNGLYRADQQLLKLFKENEKKLDNAFVFLMGDHGMRFGGIRWTPPGTVEDNNPALFISLPKHLRYNDNLRRVMRENSRQLITHFDVHATLLDIARHGAKMTVETDFQNQSQREIESMKIDSPYGSSLLRPFNKTMPRNCGTLKVPLEFCLCQFVKENVTESEAPLAKLFAQKMVSFINEVMTKRNVSEQCAPLQLNQTAQIELIEFEPASKLNIFQVTFETVPGNGKFWGYMQVEDWATQKLSFISTRFPRMNEYGDQSFCIEDYQTRPYCYCRSLLAQKDGKQNATTTILTPPK